MQIYQFLPEQFGDFKKHNFSKVPFEIAAITSLII